MDELRAAHTGPLTDGDVQNIKGTGCNGVQINGTDLKSTLY